MKSSLLMYVYSIYCLKKCHDKMHGDKVLSDEKHR